MNKKDFWSGLFSGLLIAAFLICCLVCGRIIYQSTQNDASSSQAQTLSTDGSIQDKTYDSVVDNPDITAKIKVLENTIDKYFVDDVSQNAIENGIYDGIMKSLNDPYAEYYTPEEFVEMMNSTEGVYYGIGAVLLKNTTTLYPQITGILKNSPAEESDLQVCNL